MKHIIKIALTIIYLSFKFIFTGAVALLVGWVFFKQFMDNDIIAVSCCSALIIIATYKALDIMFDYIEGLFEY